MLLKHWKKSVFQELAQLVGRTLLSYITRSSQKDYVQPTSWHQLMWNSSDKNEGQIGCSDDEYIRGESSAFSAAEWICWIWKFRRHAEVHRTSRQTVWYIYQSNTTCHWLQTCTVNAGLSDESPIPTSMQGSQKGSLLGSQLRALCSTVSSWPCLFWLLGSLHELAEWHWQSLFVYCLQHFSHILEA